MTKPEAIAALAAIKDAQTAFDANWDKLCDLLHCHPESPIFGAFGKIEELALDNFAIASGIHKAAVHWLVYDNDWGAKGLVCAPNGDGFVKIDSIEAFVEFEMDLGDMLNLRQKINTL